MIGKTIFTLGLLLIISSMANAQGLAPLLAFVPGLLIFELVAVGLPFLFLLFPYAPFILPLIRHLFI